MEDLVVIGAGSAGLTAARFAAQIGAQVALVEKSRIGGDCTWTGCVPSKALLKVAKVAHMARQTHQFGIAVNEPTVGMSAVRAYIQQAIHQIYKYETPEVLEEECVRVVMGTAHFLDNHSIQVGDELIESKYFLLATGSRPNIPPIEGLSDVPYWTNETIFENERLPEHLLIIGAGPTGVEIGQAYRRLGAVVTLIDEKLLPGVERETADVLAQVFEREELNFTAGLVQKVYQEADEIVLTTESGETVRGDAILVATGRRPNVTGLGLKAAGVAYSENGIEVNERLQTTTSNIYAAGDCLGGLQFTHLAGWQAFQAARNALLPGSEKGFKSAVPWTIYTDPEIAQVGMTEVEALERFGDMVCVTRQGLEKSDRAVVENDKFGFLKLIHKTDGTLLGATIISGRAGETINEIGLALEQQLKLEDLANSMHVYPSYGMDVMRMTADSAVQDFLNSITGKIACRLRGFKTLPS